MEPRDLKLLLYDHAVSQRELGRRLGVSEQTISVWVNGKKPIPPKRQEQIKEALATPEVPPPQGMETLTA